MARRRAALVLLAVLTLTAVCAYLPRKVAGTTLRIPGRAGWFAEDADSFYHMRRLARTLETGLPVAETDPFLNFPEGARIPWPPYYTLLLAATIGPFTKDAPQGSDAWRGSLERAVATAPLVLGILTSVVVALAASVLAGPLAGLFAGIYHAFCLGSVAYSRLGNGDHHAWVALLMALFFLVLSAALSPGTFASKGRGTRYGLAAGLVGGVLVGSWVASLLYILELELLLGLLLFVDARREGNERDDGLATFGLAFHAGALASLLPAILTSPWKDEFPWMVVNLSWFHAAHLLLGGLVFVPLLRLRTEAARRRYPWIVAAAVALLGLAILLLDAGPGRGVREGFAWVSRADEFMSGIQESRPLIGGAAQPGELVRLLGHGVWLFPVAWALAAWRGARGRVALLPFVVCAVPLALQAATQARFANSFSVPHALLLGVFVGTLLEPSRRALATRPRTPRVATGIALTLAVGAGAILLQSPTSLPVLREAGSERTPQGGPRQRRARGTRAALEWLRDADDMHNESSVLANWARGHAIEWVAGRPTVATNFGSYVGRDSYADPGRFFLSEDDAAAEALLERRRARYVVVSSQWPIAVSDMIRAAFPERDARYLDRGSESSAALRDPWFRTLGARLLFGGLPHERAGLPTESVDFLRMVHAGTISERQPALAPLVGEGPGTWIWERVPGARLEAQTEPGRRLSVDFEVEFGQAGYRLRFARSTVADASGVARLRIPYSTRGTNGDGIVSGAPKWSLGDREGRLDLSVEDVLGGRVVSVP